MERVLFDIDVQNKRLVERVFYAVCVNAVRVACLGHIVLKQFFQKRSDADVGDVFVPLVQADNDAAAFNAVFDQPCFAGFKIGAFFARSVQRVSDVVAAVGARSDGDEQSRGHKDC